MNYNQETISRTIFNKEKGIALFQSRFDEAFDDEDREEVAEILISLHLNLIKALYSNSEDFEVIKSHLRRIFQLMEYCEFEDEYVESLWLLSISYVLNFTPSEVEILKERILENEYNDFVVSSILHEMFPNIPINDHLNWKNPYQKLQGILQLKQNADVLLLKEYLEKHWYAGHSDMSWYDCHKKENCDFSGYWAFETAALVKMYNLDDSILQGLDYYPSDLLASPRL